MIESVVISNERKIVFLILDGLGDIPDKRYNDKTPLEVAKKPNIDSLSLEFGILGRIIPVEIGITPGSGPAHLSLFGYDPLKHEIGRGVLEALGLDMELKEGDLAARANFCTVQAGIVIDRRAGRLSTEETRRICAMISEEVRKLDGIEVIIKPGKSHRFVVLFRGKDLSDRLTDADPHKDGLPYIYPQPKEKEAEFTAKIVKEFLFRAQKVLSHEKTANGILLRGFSMMPKLTPFKEKYMMGAASICTYPMYRGISRILGMEVLGNPTTKDEIVSLLKDNFGNYEFFFIHVKETDTAGEDGNFEEKTKVIEEVDKLVPEIWELKPDVMVITGDHSTPCLLKGHSWHPCPILILSRYGERDRLEFHEKNCLRGSIGTIYSKNLMNLVLAMSAKLDKFGA
ncbi:MAG: 2,3-bisphosphoglycerate-independent phosphoglycerate mutase [Desulfobacterota bacterium]|nr:2,3-bisphosphoglycerate-independent phosphoglycerate mutase [Thermodesulfobacteriota bacterium]MDW8002191.1 2,3-bisphosphoglycerate-independent phosphoglycerate mutase [Deltaproteobacteria bacterium]